MSKEQDMETNYKYDERKRELSIKRKHKLYKSGKEEPVGERELVDILPESGVRDMMKELNAQKNSYQQQSKNLMAQIEELKDVDIDHEFMTKLDAVQQMKAKQQKLDQLKNADDAIKELNRQINDVKAAVGDRLKW